MSNEKRFQGISDTITEFNYFSRWNSWKFLFSAAKFWPEKLEKPKTNVNLIWYSHGLWMPKWSFYFIKIPNFWALADNLTDKFWDILTIIKWFISIHFGTASPLFRFSINQPSFLQKLNLYIQIQNIYLGLGLKFEFGLQRIKNLAIVCL